MRTENLKFTLSFCVPLMILFDHTKNNINIQLNFFEIVDLIMEKKLLALFRKFVMDFYKE
jgi:hypothetical protein